jgi:hypothetical protein
VLAIPLDNSLLQKMMFDGGCLSVLVLWWVVVDLLRNLSEGFGFLVVIFLT